jgi:hypothetical protein
MLKDSVDMLPTQIAWMARRKLVDPELFISLPPLNPKLVVAASPKPTDRRRGFGAEITGCENP